MKFSKSLKQDKGVAGLTILLSLVTTLFVLGLLIMVYALMGGELASSTTVIQQYSSTATQDVANITGGLDLTACAGVPNGAISSVTSVINDTDGGVYASTDYSYTGCSLANASLIMDNVNVTYAYTYSGESYDIINDTVEGISGTVDWFDIFIVIGAMVVLILLVVIIITAVRGSGMMGGESRSSGGNVGYA